MNKTVDEVISNWENQKECRTQEYKNHIQKLEAIINELEANIKQLESRNKALTAVIETHRYIIGLLTEGDT